MKLNSFVNYKLSLKKLQCGTQKCNKMHIGRTQDERTCTDLHVDGWKEDLFMSVKTGKSNLKRHI